MQVALSPRGTCCLRTHDNGVRMLRPQPDADNPSGNVPQDRNGGDQPQCKRSPNVRPLAQGTQQHPVLDQDLKPLGGSRGPHAAALHRLEMAISQNAPPQRVRQEIGCLSTLL